MKNHRENRDEKVYFFDKPRNVGLVLKVLYALCAALLALDFVAHRHVYLVWEKLPGFYALYGFIACVALVLVARGIRRLLKRREDYYKEDYTEGDGDVD